MLGNGYLRCCERPGRIDLGPGTCQGLLLLRFRYDDISIVFDAEPIVFVVAITNPVDLSQRAIIGLMAQFGAYCEAGGHRYGGPPMTPTIVVAVTIVMSIEMVAIAAPMVSAPMVSTSVMTAPVMMAASVVTASMVMTTVAQCRRHTRGQRHCRSECDRTQCLMHFEVTTPVIY